MSAFSDSVQLTLKSTIAVLKGMKRTLSEIPRAKWTVQYPDVPITVQPRYRGQHLLHVDEAGKEKCVACYLCAAACPSDCIYIEAEDDARPYAERIGRDERYAKVYNIDYGRCIFCGFCVEACPCDAIRMDTGIHPAPYDSRDQFIYAKDLLLKFRGRDGSRKSAYDPVEQGQDGHPGADRDHSH